MTKTTAIPQLARDVANASGISIDKAESAIKSLVDSIGVRLRDRGERVYIKGLGTFEARTRKSRRVKSPITKGVTVWSRTNRRACFTPSKALKRMSHPGVEPSVLDEYPM